MPNNKIYLQDMELAKASDIPTVSAAGVSGDYNDLINKPSLATVATSGSYNDLTNKPSLAAVATSGAYSDLSGTPNLATVATTGSYNDLTNKPTHISRVDMTASAYAALAQKDANTIYVVSQS